MQLLLPSGAKGTDLSEGSYRVPSVGAVAAAVAFAVLPLAFRHP